MHRVPAWSELEPFVGALSRRLDLPASTTIFPAGEAAFVRAATAFVEAAREVYGVTLRLDSPQLLPNWPRGNDEVNGTRSLDAFVAQHLTVPDVAAWFNGATFLEPKTDEDALRFETIVDEHKVVDAELVIYALGATLATSLGALVEARWVGGATVDLSVEAPPSIRLGPASVSFPFELAKMKLLDPRSNLWPTRVSIQEAPPPRGLASTIEEAEAGWPKLLPEGTFEWLDGWDQLGAEEALDRLEARLERGADNALLLRLMLPIATQLPTLERAASLARRMVAAYPHVNAKFGLADVLTFMPGHAQAEGERLFREVLSEQPMMTRARLKLGLLLAEQGRRLEAITELRAVASTWGDDAAEARAVLEQLGASEDDGAPASFGVILGTVADLAQWLTPSLVREQGARAVFFVAKRAARKNQLLQRIPEGPCDAESASAIFRAIEAFVAAHQLELTGMLGEATFSAGFHATASLDEARPSFETDGFALVGQLEGGKLRRLEEGR
jgi:hypothetical protein